LFSINLLATPAALKMAGPYMESSLSRINPVAVLYKQEPWHLVALACQDIGLPLSEANQHGRSLSDETDFSDGRLTLSNDYWWHCGPVKFSIGMLCPAFQALLFI
jgi:hypothetical protein